MAENHFALSGREWYKIEYLWCEHLQYWWWGGHWAVAVLYHLSSDHLDAASFLTNYFFAPPTFSAELTILKLHHSCSDQK